MTRDRLDRVLEARRLVASRSRARDLVRRGLVRVDGVIVCRPAQIVGSDARIDVSATEAGWVSRGGDKLAAALDAFGYEVEGRFVLDVGASTGGFSQAALARGARQVACVDVGSAQLHPRLSADPRVTDLSPLDARDLTPDHLGRVRPDAVVVDLSFIALAQAVGPALELACRDAWLIALVKPQFEVGPAHVGKGGIVRSRTARQAALDGVCHWLSSVGWPVEVAMHSPIAGKGGNREFLIGARRRGPAVEGRGA